MTKDPFNTTRIGFCCIQCEKEYFVMTGLLLVFTHIDPEQRMGITCECGNEIIFGLLAKELMGYG